MSRLAGRAWTELTAADTLLAVPLGALEQHGPHLPLDTDARVALALADALAERRPDVTVAPVVSYGASGEHESFPGTVSIGQDALELLLVELVRSAGRTFRHTLLVSGHGGNAEPLRRAVRRLRAEGRSVLAWLPRVPGGDAHAGRTETSLMLALAPHLVRLAAAVPGNATPLAGLLADLRATGVRSVSANGVLGDPTGASAAEGRRVLAALVGDLGAAVQRWLA